MLINKVEICGVNTSKLPLLTNDEKKLLFERIKKGDQEAREIYIKGNLRLVLSVIKRFSSSSENADDLFQIGCIGLMKAIDNFDCTMDVKFSTYAVPMIVGEIRRYLRDNNSIRDLIGKIHKSARTFFTVKCSDGSDGSQDRCDQRRAKCQRKRSADHAQQFSGRKQCFIIL